MIKNIRTMTFVLLVSIFGAVNAFAANFSAQDLQNVIHAMEAMDSEKLPKAMEPLNRFADGEFNIIMDEAGNLEVFSHMFDASLESIDEYKHLQKISQTNGFTSVRDWAEKSDAVLMVYMLTQIPRPTLDTLVEITPEQLKEFPEDERSGILDLKKLGLALLALPQDDIDTFAPYAAQYEGSLK